MAKKKRKEDNAIATNRKARHDYTVLETIECGLVLTGTEIKSIRRGRVNLKDSFARIVRGEVWMYGVHISPFEEGNRYNVDPVRPRKLLLKRAEINRLERRTAQEGYTLIPLKLYIKRGYAKILLGVCKGKKLYDKRQTLKERDMKREIQRSLKSY